MMAGSFTKQSTSLAMAAILAVALCLGFASATLAGDADVSPSIAPSVEIAAPPMPEVDHPSGVTDKQDASGGEHAEDNIGFPQLDPSSYASQIFWLAVAFVLLYGLMSETALPKIEEVLENRRNQREGNLGQAEQFRAESEKIRIAYEEQLAKAQDEAQKVMAETEADIKEISMARTAAFAEGARARIAKSEETVNAAKKTAMASVADIAADITVEVSGKIASCAVNRADAKTTVQSVMKEAA